MLWLLVLGAISAAAASAPAQQPAVEGDPANAATWYRAAYAAYKAVEFEMDLYEHTAAFDNDPDRGPSPQARQFLRRYRETVDLTRRTAHRDFCDFGPYDGHAPDPAFPTGAIRTLAVRLMEDYRVQVFDGDVHEAINEICDVIRLSSHSASQKAPIPVLVAAALTHMADRMIQHAIDRALIGPNEATRLLREYDELKGPDPYDFRNAMIVERTSEIEREIAQYSGADGLQRFRDECLPYYQQQQDAAAIEALGLLSRAELDQFLATWRSVHERTLAAMRDPDGLTTRAALEAIDKEIKDGVHGPYARLRIGYSAWAFVEADRVRKLLDDRVPMLRGLADGTVDPLSLANAACWYIRASVQIEQVDPERLALIDAHAARDDPHAAIDPKLAEALKRDDVRSVLDRLATAATIERCDFSYATGNWMEYYRPYHAGILACGRLLAVDAMRLLGEARHDDAASRLSQMLRLSSEVARDGCIAGSLAAHRLFDSAQAIIASLVEGGLNA